MPKRGRSNPKSQRTKTKRIKTQLPSRSTQLISYLITIVLLVLNIMIPFIYYYGLISEPTTIAASSIVLSLLFSSAVFSYLLYRGKNIKTIISELGLSRDKATPKNIALGFGLWLCVIILSLAIGIFSKATNIPLPTNVQQALAGTPAYFLAFTFLLAPINEEILFRGFGVPRIGIILTSILFALSHLSYLSISEFAAAFIFALLAGYLFKKTKSLYPSIIGHMLVNFITVLSLISIGMMIHI